MHLLQNRIETTESRRICKVLQNCMIRKRLIKLQNDLKYKLFAQIVFNLNWYTRNGNKNCSNYFAGENTMLSTQRSVFLIFVKETCLLGLASVKNNLIESKHSLFSTIKGQGTLNEFCLLKLFSQQFEY